MVIIVGVAGVIVIVVCDGKSVGPIKMKTTLTTWSSDSSHSHMGVRASVHPRLLVTLTKFFRIHNRTRKSLVLLGILLVTTHLPTVVIAAVGMTTAGIEPSNVYTIVPGCFLDTAASGVFWNVITFTPSVVRC